MKSIINNKLYDTDKSEYIITIIFGKHIYKTSKGNYFILNGFNQKIIPISIGECKNILKEKPEQYINEFPDEAKENKELKDILAAVNPYKYMELFGTVEEA